MKKIETMMKLIVLVMFTTLISCNKTIVNGCMDVNAVNYDPSATIEDGSCYYHDTNNPTNPNNPNNNDGTTTITIREDLQIDVEVTLVIEEKATGDRNEYTPGLIVANSPFNMLINDDYILYSVKITAMTPAGLRTEEYRITDQGIILQFDRNNKIAIGVNTYIQLQETAVWNYEIIIL